MGGGQDRSRRRDLRLGWEGETEERGVEQGEENGRRQRNGEKEGERDTGGRKGKSGRNKEK